jgi:hypothetical protein
MITLFRTAYLRVEHHNIGRWRVQDRSPLCQFGVA